MESCSSSTSDAFRRKKSIAFAAIIGRSRTLYVAWSLEALLLSGLLRLWALF